MGKRFHPGRETCNVYVVFTEKDHALKSLEANNTVVTFHQSQMVTVDALQYVCITAAEE